MYKTIIMNAKGGCGKTTIATNLVSYYASHGYTSALFDYDPQCSGASWLKRRDEKFPAVQGISACQQGCSGSATRSWLMRLVPETERVVIDTPAALKPYDAVSYLKGVSTIIVPVLASVIDVEASAQFVHELMKQPYIRRHQTRIVVVANRVKARSPALKIMKEIFENMGVPVVAQLKETACYVQGTDSGLGIHELPSKRAQAERETWQKLVEAVDPDFEFERNASDNTLSMPTIQSLSDKVLSDIPLSIPLAEAGRYSVSWK